MHYNGQWDVCRHSGSCPTHCTESIVVVCVCAYGGRKGVREGWKTVCKSKCVCVITTEKVVEYIVCQSKGACVLWRVLC